MQPDELHPATVVADKYTIVRTIDSGGMGTVYEVSYRGESLAMKVMHPRLVQDSGFRARFDQEIRIGTALSNQHVVKVRDHGIDPRHGPYLVMDLLRGETLDSLVQREGRLTVPYARQILAQLCDAVGSAHVAGIIHRDLKPGNVFLIEPGAFVKVVDFGIAKVVGHGRAASSEVLGTPAWMAPEQLNTRQPIGPPTDVWAIGLLAFQMLTGKPFWRSEPTSWSDLSMEICSLPLPLASIRAAEVGALGSLPDGFDGWFQRCVNRDLNARFTDARVAYEELKPLVRTKLINPTPSPSPVSAAPRASSPEIDPDEREIQVAVSALRSRIEITLQTFRRSSQPSIISVPPTDPQRPAPAVRPAHMSPEPQRVSGATPAPVHSPPVAPPSAVVVSPPRSLPVQAPVSYPPVPVKPTGLSVAAAVSFLVMALLVLLVLIGLAASRSPAPELAPPAPVALLDPSPNREGG